MDSPSVQLIQDAAVQAAGKNNLGNDLLLVRNDQSVKDLEAYAPHRRRYRGELKTRALADFVAYAIRHAEKGKPVEAFVDVDNMAAKVFFNLGNQTSPGHADFRASLNLTPTAAYSALLNIDGAKQSQKELAEWLEDWNDYLLAQFDGDEGTLARAITAIRKITIKAKSESTTSTTNTGGARSAFEEIEAQSANDLPIGFSFTCEPYVGLSTRTFRLILSVLTGEEKPKLVLRLQRREDSIERIASEFKTVLGEQLGNTATLTLGSFTP